MCYHNYTQHNGCGHIGERHSSPWKLCAEAERRLVELRGPSAIMSPPLDRANSTPFFSQSRNPGKLSKRFASFSLSRSGTTASSSSATRRALSGPVSPVSSSRTSTSSRFSSLGENVVSGHGIPDHQFEAVRCKGDAVEVRTTVTSDMEVCKECKIWIGEMRFMIERYEKTGTIKGTMAFEEFLKWRGEWERDEERDR
ncbi:uncharacterized protein EI97DRAFT_466191 [Westerdykella ornata]|uniref:Uncharacterized protein n=1 Tax=Westerdykella ornata TaxID=318751 RepID=A0A6A6JQR1_WESOR|nr:uncharacterized protein EI97DRAFT_466191 [Westerdykella ornata]KAF2277299.1 hypothetical protein EI97DRAFT_466191 [Westerdykella ornata]